MRPITLDTLRAICPMSKAAVLEPFVDALNAAFEEFEVNTEQRQAHFLAQAAHESGGFRYMKELASGADYEGRKDLGNDLEGEGVLFKGRGIFQLTGDANYRAAGQALHGDDQWYTFDVSRAEDPVEACRIAGWYWKSRGLNELADRNDIKAITKRINGGYTHLAERVGFWQLARAAVAA